MGNEIHIALSPDDDYTEHAAVCAISACENMRGESLVFHILDTGLCEASKRSFLTIAETYRDVQVVFEKIDSSIFNAYRNSERYSIQTLLPMILPEIKTCKNLKRIIYLDSDIVVKSSLKPLWDMEFGNNYIMAVEDIESKRLSRKFLKGREKFFNSGVMVLNCDMWRRDDISLRAVKMAIDNSNSVYGCCDNVLNILFAGFVKFLDLKWNLQYSPMDIYPEFENNKEFEEAIKNPAIIHFFGEFKPWELGFGHFCPKQEDYLRYHKLTLYKKENYKNFQAQDRANALRGLMHFIFYHPLFFLESGYWRNIFKKIK